MAVSPVTYEEFRASNQALVTDGGPWKVTFGTPAVPSKSPICSRSHESYCEPTGYCLHCRIFPPDNVLPNQITYTANISVDATQYENVEALEFKWTFWPLFLGSKVTPETTIPINSRVGNASFSDIMLAGNLAAFSAFPNNNFSWGDTPVISHSGTANTEPYGSRRYLSISIDYSFNPGTSNEYMNHYIKGIGFEITTPVKSVIPATSSPPLTNTSANATSSTTLNSTASRTRIPSEPSLFSGSSFGPEVSSLATTETSQVSQTKMTSAAIIGMALGSTVLVICLFGLICLGLRRRKRHNSADLRESYTSLTPYTLEKGAVELSHIRNVRSPISRASLSAHEASPRTSNPQSRARSMLNENYPPPIYVINGPHAAYDIPPVTQALVMWAQAHRELISEDLEARLEAAGYVPTDNPDILSENEWISQHNVTKLEVARLRALYEEHRRRLSHSPSNAAGD